MSQTIALVTGGSRGLGKNAALKLAARGVNIILTYNSQQQEALNVVREIELTGVKAVAIQLNVAESAGFAAFAAQVKQQLHDVWQRDSFDYLLNNAGTGLDALFEKTTEQQFDDLMNIHLKGP
uniref:SDR family NAD(P)-dependent oxidoreductase n=1 Tax=Buttiauxella brennerae TaxID=82988 RepID=UPI00286EFF8F